MSKNTAFYGGHSIYTLGPASDVSFFFRCIESFLPKRLGEPGPTLITDRLFRRYLRQEDLAGASDQMRLIHQSFSTQKASRVDWHSLGLVTTETRLSLNTGTLSEVFEAYFVSFDKAKNSAISFFEAFNRYNPVRIVFADLPDFAIDKRRALEQYDANQSAPFWARQ